MLPEDFVIYLDENLHNCRPILEALTLHNVPYERHGAHFASGAEDTDWLPFVGHKGWVVVTKDKRIRYNQLEVTALLHNQVREFYFTSGNYSGADMAGILMAALSEMGKFYRKQKPPFIASIARSGKVSLRFPEAKEPKV